MIINRTWAMPNKETFKIHPIKELLNKYVPKNTNNNWIDFFARTTKLAQYSNDINPKYKTTYNENPGGNNPRNRGANKVLNYHPTVKPIALMRYLVRMVTPPNGTVLDPHAGSGTTGIACKKEGFNFIGIDNKKDYIEIAKARTCAHSA